MSLVHNCGVQKKLSVVIPAYNAEKYIKRSVDSALNQADVEIEVIVVNDGSKDATTEILHREYGGEKRVKIFDRDNHGLYRSRVFGISKASYEYITFIDADDYVIKDFYAGIIGLFTEEIDVIEFGTTVYDESNRVIEKNKLNHTLWNHEVAIRRVVVRNNCACSVCDKIYRLKLFKIKEMDLDVRQYEEDLLMNILALKNADKMLVTSQMGYCYCKHGNSITTSKINPEKMESLKTWSCIFDEMEKNRNLEKFAAMAYCNRLAYNYCLFMLQTGKADCYRFIEEEFKKIYRKYKLWKYVYRDGESFKRRVMPRLFSISPAICVKVFGLFVKM